MELRHIYNQKVLHEIPRMLSLQDREQNSTTCGSFDRTFWSWKFTDFPGARFQEGVYSLAHLYKYNFDGNFLYQNDKVFDWTIQGFHFWTKIQYDDGSFDEAYPFEHSLAAVSFTGFYLCEAYLLIQDQISSEQKQDIENCIIKAANWLCRNDEKHGVLSNHLAAAAAFLCIAHKVSGDEIYNERSNFFLKRILEKQSSEGWYEEYGGADPGYQTHAIFYLARIWQITKSKDLFESLRLSIEFIQFFIHPNGTLGGEYASRNTEFYFPAGFEILAEHIPQAASIACFMRTSIEKNQSVGLSQMDAYNFFPLFNNYLFASKNMSAISNSTLPFQSFFTRDFIKAGLMIRSNESYYAIIGVSKGGTLRIYDRTNNWKCYLDSGYIISTKENLHYSNQRFGRTELHQKTSSELHTKSQFFLTKNLTLNPILFLGFRTFTLTLGRLSHFSYWIKNFLVHVLIRRNVKSPLTLDRKITFDKDTIQINDRIELATKLKLRSIQSHPKFSTIHMGSSRYFQKQDLETNSISDYQNHITSLIETGQANIQRKFNFNMNKSGNNI